MNKNKKYKKNMKRQRQLRNNVRTVEMWLQKENLLKMRSEVTERQKAGKGELELDRRPILHGNRSWALVQIYKHVCVSVYVFMCVCH